MMLEHGHDHKDEIRLGTVWVDKSLAPLLPAAIFAVSRMVLDAILPICTDVFDDEFGTKFFLAAEIVAQTLKAAKVEPEVVDAALLGRDIE